MFARVLIANRGEIACRIIRTCRQLGVESVAVYSDADANALHVRLADRAVRLGPAPAVESYLAQERVIEAARETGAEAVHPGYGFLSENDAFAERCAEAGLVFVGPPAAAIRAMGAKDEAKRLMIAAGVPCVPGYHGDDTSLPRLVDEAERIGFPLLVKAAAGGGGKGMRIVRRSAELADAIAAAQGEARRSFGDDRVLLERYLEGPRHIEAQIIADTRGQALYLFERECTLQRRHQKVVEEAPSPSLDAAARVELGETAVRAAKAIGYVNAGTIEFLWADGRPWFIEMNTRLQVEHPVTEMITGLDIVALQLAIASGKPLALAQNDIHATGHAVEARLYAEDPANGFLPSAGRVHALRWPPAAEHLRIETGVVAGDEVGVDYDPMIAKVVAHGPDRRTALRRLDQALASTRLTGLFTNRGYLRSVIRTPEVVENRIDTTTLERLEASAAPHLEADALRLAIADRLAERQRRAERRATLAGDPWSPWQAIDGFRLSARAPQSVRLTASGELVEAAVVADGNAWHVHFVGEAESLRLAGEADGDVEIDVDGRRIEGLVTRAADDRWVSLADGDLLLRRVASVASGATEMDTDGTLRAPMPGRVVEVAVTLGADVAAGALVLKLEAMKMEHRVLAEVGGKVVEIAVATGDQVAANARLVVIEPAEEVAP